MPSAQYNGGRKLEYATIHTLTGIGFTVATRTAGSHSPIDVWAIDQQQGLFLVQCKKSRNITRNKRMELWALADMANGRALVASWYKPSRSAARRVMLEEVTMTGELFLFALGQDEEVAS